MRAVAADQRLGGRRPSGCPDRRSCPRAARSACRRPAPRPRARRRPETTDRRRPRAPRRARPDAGAGRRATTSLDAGDARRNRRHQQRRGQRIQAAGHVAADAIERDDALLDADAGAPRSSRKPRGTCARATRRMCRAARRIAARTRAGSASARRAPTRCAGLRCGPARPSSSRGVAPQRAVAARAARRRQSAPRAARSPRRARARSTSSAATALTFVDSNDRVTILSCPVDAVRCRRAVRAFTARSCSADTRRCPARPRPSASGSDRAPSALR